MWGNLLRRKLRLPGFISDPSKTKPNYQSIGPMKKSFGSQRFSKPTFWETCFFFVVKHEVMYSLFPFLAEWKAHIL